MTAVPPGGVPANRRKVSLRVTGTEQLEWFCTLHGVTMAAWFQVATDMAKLQAMAFGFVPVERWPPGDRQRRFARCVAAAREVDARRRCRQRPMPGEVVPTTRRLSVRIDDMGPFERFCDVNGVSIAGYLQAMVDVTAVWLMRVHGGTPAWTWPKDPMTEQMIAQLELARSVDGERRTRRY